MKVLELLKNILEGNVPPKEETLKSIVEIETLRGELEAQKETIRELVRGFCNSIKRKG